VNPAVAVSPPTTTAGPLTDLAATVGARFDIPPASIPPASTAPAPRVAQIATPSGESSPVGGPRVGDLPAGIPTAREAEIARVVALGLTNKEIAVALTISPKTVAAHVEHILAKLGFARRAQIATWAATQS
jgi:DNA-binding NarL/FixJ family response regulator